MQNLVATDLLYHYTGLVNTAILYPQDLPLKICEYLTNYMDFQAVVFFTVDDQNNFIVQGKSGSAKQNFAVNAAFQCNACKAVNNNGNSIIFNNIADCEIQASENVREI
jgi:hypothetical protein